jgi:site-specific DNA recombinase
MARRRPLSAVPDRPQRVVLYRRVSALMGRGGDDFHSPDIQLATLRQATVGMVEVDIIDDIGETGTTLDRAGIHKIRAMVERHEVDLVAFMNASRLGRNVLESLLFVKWLEDRGVGVLSADHQMDTRTRMGHMMLVNMLAVAEDRSRQIGESWSDTIHLRALAGKHHGKPFGYRHVKEQPIQPHPVNGPIVTWVFEAYARGEPIGKIARVVSDRRGLGTPTVNVKKWLRNPVYLGHVTASGQIVVKHAHPPLVGEEVWERVQARLRADRVAPPRHLAPTWPLVGLVVCPDGHRLQRLPTVYRGELVDRLTCGRGSSRGAGHPCPGVGQPRLAPVEAEVLRQVAGYIRLLRTDEASRVARVARRAHSLAQRDELERELGRTRTAMARLSKRWALGELVDAEYEGPRDELRAAEAELVRQLDVLDAPVVSAPPRVIAQAGERMLRLWPDATVAERARLLRLVVRRVVVRRAVRWREPEADRVTVEF